MADYNSGTVLERNLYFLLPFLPFNDEKRFQVCNEDDTKLGQLLTEYQSVLFDLDNDVKDRKVEGQTIQDLVTLFAQVADRLAENYGKVRKGVAGVMSSAKFWLESDRVREEGRLEGIVDTFDLLVETGVSEHTALEMIAERKGTTVKEIEEVVYGKEHLVGV